MSNSSLVSFTQISPNKTSPRNHKIDTITIHCVVGQISVETIGAIFAPSSKKASSNYGIGYDGRIGMYVEEKDRSWCSSSGTNDNRAITIECASDMTDPYAVNDKVYESLINLLVDICRRNGIKELKWKGDKSLVGQIDKQNMTVHRWFANKACPGDYLYNRHGDIANRVNAMLNAGTPVSDDPEPIPIPYNELVYGKSLLKKGKKGDAVKTLQIILISLGYDLGKWGADGSFGGCTEQAVKKFQNDHNLDDDGVVGPLTYAELDKESKKQKYLYEGVTTASVLRIRSGPSTSYSQVGSLICGSKVQIMEESDGWGKIESGWIYLGYVIRE